MATPTSLETRETTSLIGSDKVEGTAVYGADQQKIGTLERVMKLATDGINRCFDYFATTAKQSQYIDELVVALAPK